MTDSVNEVSIVEGAVVKEAEDSCVLGTTVVLGSSSELSPLVWMSERMVSVIGSCQ